MCLYHLEENPTLVEEFVPREKLYCTLRESNQWARMMEIPNVGALNDLSKGKLNELILVQEATGKESAK